MGAICWMASNQDMECASISAGWIFSNDRTKDRMPRNKVWDARRPRIKNFGRNRACGGGLFGMGGLSPGRALRSQTTAKHNIKRVGDFPGNAQVEVGRLTHVAAPNAHKRLNCVSCHGTKECIPPAAGR